MPYINTKTNKRLSDEEKRSLKARLGEDIALIPGKSERWLMLGFEDGITMAFAGDMESPMAMVDVEIFGKASEESYRKLTRAITDSVAESAGIAKDKIYVKYREVDVWGFNGENF